MLYFIQYLLIVEKNIRKYESFYDARTPGARPWFYRLSVSSLLYVYRLQGQEYYPYFYHYCYYFYYHHQCYHYYNYQLYIRTQNTHVTPIPLSLHPLVYSTPTAEYTARLTRPGKTYWASVSVYETSNAHVMWGSSHTHNI